MPQNLETILDKLCCHALKDQGIAYFVMDELERIKHWGGNIDQLALSAPSPGTRISDILIFMEGLLPLSERIMDFSGIKLPSGINLDALVFRLESGHGLIISDSSKKEAYLAPAKQKANELNLAIREQKRILARLSGQHAASLTDPFNEKLYNDFLKEFFLALNFAVLEMDDQGKFYLFGPPPPWIDLISQSEQLLDGGALEDDVFSFLGNFIQESKERWERENFTGYKSGLWAEKDSLDQEYLFEATSVVIHGRHLLIISRDVCAPDEKQSIIQKGRDLALNVNTMKQSGRRLKNINDELELRVKERTKELEEANKKLSLELIERKRAERERTMALEQLRQSQKLEAIGTLAGGVAHDFNNILSAIIGNTELALLDNKDIDRDPTRLNKILKASNRAKKLVNQILTFSHQDNEDNEPVRLSRVVEEVLSLIEVNLPEDVTVIKEIRSTAYTLGNHTQFHQVIMNLCTNAWQAMEGRGGKLRVELTQTDGPPPEAGSEPDTTPYLLLKIQDTGLGIPPQVMERLFDPYFTTKEEGTGLGLSVVMGIVRKSQGHILVDTEPGKGSLFNLYFPIWQLNAD